MTPQTRRRSARSPAARSAARPANDRTAQLGLERPRLRPNFTSSLYPFRASTSGPGLPIEVLMGSWTSALVPRIAAFVVLGLFATATLTWAAEKRLTVATPSRAPAAVEPITVIVV